MLPDLHTTLSAQQHRLANHLRNPSVHPAPPGLEDRRMHVYRELFFKNISGLLTGMFPVISGLYTSSAWQTLVRQFYAGHRCETPYFPEIGQEFIAWLQKGNDFVLEKPFLAELAHYEWVELALSLSDASWPMAVCVDSDVMGGVPVVSPLCWPLSYLFPVQKLHAGFQPVEPSAEPTCLLVYRDESDAVHVVESNNVSIRLIEILQKNHMRDASMALTGEQALLVLSQELQQTDPHTVLQFGQALLLTWQRQGLIACAASA
jgi:hypothetical protein